MLKWLSRNLIVGVVGISVLFGAGVCRAGGDGGFKKAKTIFQTNCAYDSRIAIAVDAVVVHRHGTSFVPQIESWRDKGFTVGRMFFADSDAANAYWTGKWDGTPHRQDVERDKAGNVIKCANIRPYMLPTDGWISYLEEMDDASLAAGAAAILPEEPLAHVFSGYEGSFRDLWVKRYGSPWQGQDTSALARFQTAQLKGELYIKLEKSLMKRTKRGGGDAAFVLPIHAIYSNIAAQLVAPLGTSVGINGVDGYIGQIWTGPVNWALGCYDSPRKSFFGSAYVLYDYFTQLTAESDKKLWLLVDPVEDNPAHKWSEFAEWYKHCIVAMLLMDDVDSYEIMPWPDRIFMPGYQTGGGTPAPQDYRSTILAVTQVLQEVPLGGRCFDGQWPAKPAGKSVGRVGVAMADTLMWQRHDNPMLQGVYSLFMPLIDKGIAVSSCILERLDDARYMSNFDVIVLSYEAFKPINAGMNESLIRWVKQGGSLVVLGGQGDELDRCEQFWWHKLGFDSPLAHLLAGLGVAENASGPVKVGKGWVLRNGSSPKAFADPAVAANTYVPLVRSAIDKAGRLADFAGGFCMQRGPFVIAHADTEPVELKGTLIDVFDPSLGLVNSVKLTAGQSGLYRDVAAVMGGDCPAVLHATHRLVSSEYSDGALHFVVRGPAQTPATARVFAPDAGKCSVKAVGSDGKAVDVDSKVEGRTLLLQLPNDPQGVSVVVR